MERTLPTLIDEFCTQKLTEGRTQRTVGWYRQMLLGFDRFLGKKAHLTDVTVENARKFVAHLQTRETRYQDGSFRPEEPGKLSEYTVHGYVRALKAFGTWLVEDAQLLNVDPFTRLKRPKLSDTMIQILTDEEIKILFNAINPRTVMGARLYLIMLLLLDTGIRASELLTLKVEDVDLTREQFVVMGKGRKERRVPFGAATKKALLSYMHTYRPVPVDESVEYLILTRAGLPMSYKTLDELIKRLGRRVGIERLHPHLCRHTMAVKFLVNSGGDLMTLKEILGHTSVVVTEKYLHLANTHIKDQHRRFSPMDRLGVGSKRSGKAAAA